MGYFEHVAILMCIYIILSTSLNIILGFTGMLNLGHVAFFGIGAYTSALLAKALGFHWLAALAGGVVFAGIAGLLIGIPCLRLRGDYLAIATLGFGEIVRSLMKNWQSLTRGPLGIPGIPKPELFGFRFTDTQDFLMLAFVVMIFVVWLIHRIVHSPFGRVLRSIREDEIAAQSLGKNVVKYKLLALTFGAAFAGVAGSLYAHYITFIDPTTFSFIETVLMVAMVVLGGMGSLAGSVLGAIILVILPEPLRFIKMPTHIMAAMREIMYSVVLIMMMHFRPDGLLREGSLRKKVVHWWHRMRGVSA